MDSSLGSVKIYLWEARRIDVKERAALEEKMRKGDYQVKNRLAETYLKFVIFMVKKYMGKGIPFLDLIQAGNMGLLEAIEKFDYKKRYKFSTYARWWIIGSAQKEIAEQSKPISYTPSVVFVIRKFSEEVDNLLQELKREPNINEIASRMEISEGRVKKILRIAMNREPVSLETPIGEDDNCLGDLLEDKDSPTPFEVVFRAILKKRVNNLLDTLTHQEKRILELRYGLSGYRPHTLKEIAKEFEYSESNIYRIRSNALGKLRHHGRGGELKEYLY